MILQDHTIEGDKITITKKELEEARDHYLKVADKFRWHNDNDECLFSYYTGKANVIKDILKMFEPLEG